jgi:hypothetical protein
MSPQTETKAGSGFKAGVKDYRLTYYTPEKIRSIFLLTIWAGLLPCLALPCLRAKIQAKTNLESALCLSSSSSAAAAGALHLLSPTKSHKAF